jgi:signal transduction histidine kinase
MSTTVDGAEVELIVSAIPVPVLVADYTPIIERFAEIPGEQLRQMLLGDPALLTEVSNLPTALAASPEWMRLYGWQADPRVPRLAERHFTPAAYPELFRTLVDQFTAPFLGITSIVREHTAPTQLGDVMVRSHWSVSVDRGVPHWDKVVIVDLDVTDLRRAQRDLEATLDTKDRLVRSKDQLIASVSHEIRTPLAAIVGFAELLRDSSSDTPPDERDEMLDLLVQQSTDLTVIVDDLLITAKTDLGQLELARVALDLSTEAARVVDGIDSHSRRAITLPAQPGLGLGDPARVRQIIRNLIVNALRYGGPEIRLVVVGTDSEVTLQVRDDGSGVSPDAVSSMFDPYQRSDEPSGAVPSLGLGLHISRTLARRMDGDLTYRHEQGESVFELTLPRAGISATVVRA